MAFDLLSPLANCRAAQIFYELAETYKVRPSVFLSALWSLLTASVDCSRWIFDICDLMSLTSRLQNRGVGLYITHLKPGPHESFEKAGIVTLLGEDAFLKDVASATACIEQKVREREG